MTGEVKLDILKFFRNENKSQ